MAPPGWPDLAFSTIAADKTRILSAAEFISREGCSISFIKSRFCENRSKNTKKCLTGKILYHINCSGDAFLERFTSNHDTVL